MCHKSDVAGYLRTEIPFAVIEEPTRELGSLLGGIGGFVDRVSVFDRPGLDRRSSGTVESDRICVDGPGETCGYLDVTGDRCGRVPTVEAVGVTGRGRLRRGLA